MRCKGVELPLKAVLFDLDGTLIDSRADIAASANAVRSHYGLPPVSADIVGTYVGLGIMNLLEKTIESADPERLRDAHGVFKEHYQEHCVDYTRPYEGALELLNFLRDRKVGMGVVSNKPQEFTDLILAKLGLAPYFGAVLGPEATVHKKPHPEPLLTALQKLGAKTSEAVMIGDSTVDIEAARAANVPVGVLTHGYGSRESLIAADPDWLVDSLADFIEILS